MQLQSSRHATENHANKNKSFKYYNKITITKAVKYLMRDI